MTRAKRTLSPISRTNLGDTRLRLGGTPILALPRLLGLVLCLLSGAFTSLVAIEVQNLADRSTYVGRVGFRIEMADGFRYRAWLDQRAVSPQYWQFAHPGYHVFEVERTPNNSNQTERRVYRFVVQDPVRGGSEWGLAPWTPRPVVDSAPEEFSGAQIELIHPAAIPAEMDFPVISWIREPDDRVRRVNGRLDLEIGETPQTLILRRGVGSILIPPATMPSGELSNVTSRAHVASLQTEGAFERESATEWISLSSDITEDTSWESHSRIRLTQSIRILPGATLTVEPGTILALNPNVNITVDGTLHLQGTQEAPILLAPYERNTQWGGVFLWQEPAQINVAHTIVTGSGAHRTWFFANQGGRSHRPEQAAFYFGPKTVGDFDHVYLIDNAGQAFHGEDATIRLRHSLVQRCQTVGQINDGAMTIESSALIEFPFESPMFVDGDNDALYFTFGTHQLTDTLVGWTKDDGVDAGGNDPGQVTIDGCWFEACFHEGMALSGTNKRVNVNRSVFLNNGQGVETGYLSPRVTVTDSLFTSNLVGLRFGDNYFREHSGFLQSTGSISIFNQRDVWGLTANLWDEDLAKMAIRGNLLGRELSNYPENTVWLSSPDHPATLNNFLSHESASVGIGFLTPSATAPETPGRLPIQVGLSVFAPRAITVQLDVIPSSAEVSEWVTVSAQSLRFEPGQTSQEFSIQVTRTGMPLTSGNLTLRLSAPENATVVPRQAVYQLSFPGLSNETTLSEPGSEWAYRKGTAEASNPPTAWREASFDDSTWARGLAPFGYGDGPYGTTLTDMQFQYSTLFLRRPFHVETLANLGSLTLNANYDDGFIAWLNGVEVARVGVAGNRGDFAPFNGFANESDFPPRDARVEFNTDGLNALRLGPNVLAVQVFNTTLGSSDLTFETSLHAQTALDLDQDELPDDWENALIQRRPDDTLTDLFTVQADADWDADGANTRAEYLAGTDPLDPTSRLSLGSQLLNGEVILSFTPQTKRRYILESRETLDAPWSERQRFEPTPNPVATDVRLPQSKPSEYFRIRVEY